MTKFFKIEPKGRAPLYAVASNSNAAAIVFVTWSAARDREAEEFSVERIPVDSLDAPHQSQVRSAIALGLSGLAHFDEDLGFTFDLTQWGPFNELEES